jgi:hypothetical protein
VPLVAAMTDALVHWLDRHARGCLAGLAIVALVSRTVLVVRSPWAFGYVWDLYHEAIQRLYETGRLPASTDCWECWQPPLLFLASWPLYAIGKVVYPISPWPDDYALRFAGLIPFTAGLACLVYSDKLLRLMGQRGAWRVVGFGLAAAFPCVFFSTYALEPDILMAAIVVAFLYYLTRWHLHRDAATIADVVRLGVLAGLAAETKYNGVCALAVGTIVFAVHAVRARRVRPIATFLVVALAIGSWKYVDNMRRYGNPFFANGPAVTGFRLSERIFNTQYELTTFRLSALLALTRPDAPDGMLTTLPVYRSVWTTLHGLAWGDMGFFTNPTRHGTRYPFYRPRHVPPWLASSVLVLALVPAALAIAGFSISVRRRAYLPISVMAVVGWLLYLQYVLSQEIWALKTKYLLFLLPAYVLYAVVGLRWVRAALPGWLSVTIVLSMIALIVLANLYLISFAIG